jgi:carbamoyltransferase
MITWGINALNHGSSLAVFNNNQLVSNEFTYGDQLSYSIIANGLKNGHPEKIFWYEQPWIKKARQIRAGQWSRALDFSVLPKKFVNSLGFKNIPIIYTPHHASHAAAGYYTSPFDNAAVVVLDAIGEFECASIWQGCDGQLTKVWSKRYPHSLGLFYSAFTKLLDFTPVREEFLLQKLSTEGNADKFYERVSNYFTGPVTLNTNFHKGVLDWGVVKGNEKADIAAAVQQVFEEQVDQVMSIAKKLTGSNNLIYMGGCAMNSLYNKRLNTSWNKVWSLPDPGDPSSSIGAALYHTKERQQYFNSTKVKHLEIKL